MADHLWLNLDLKELLAVVNSDDVVDELRKDDHLTEVSLDNRWLNTLLALDGITSLLELVDELDMLDTEITREPAATARAKKLNEITDLQSLEIVKGLAAEGVVTLRELRHSKRPWSVKTA